MKSQEQTKKFVNFLHHPRDADWPVSIQSTKQHLENLSIPFNTEGGALFIDGQYVDLIIHAKIQKDSLRPFIKKDLG
ncbi:MAG: hypothetical protein K9G62_05320 [Alphaproteobacteria bacterium]|nr:hypothetical protein [Alphaproteobacteria bacterium]